MEREIEQAVTDWQEAYGEGYLITEENSPEQGQKGKAGFFNIAVLQAAVTGAVVLLCLLLRLFAGDSFSALRGLYNNTLGEETTLPSSEGAQGVGGPLEGEETDFFYGGLYPPLSGGITSRYGYRTDPFSGKTAFHSGLDIGADTGTPICAAAGGRVEQALYSDGDYGNYIIVDHGGFKTLYAHCSSLLLKAGQRVSAGDTLALVGSSGRSTGPHLHFEVRVGEVRLDPELLIGENK